jgi:6-phosphogluconolactonase
LPGDWPRNFLIDPHGDFLFVAFQNSNDMFILKRDPSTGKLTNTGVKAELPQPTCIKMIGIK